MDPLDPDRPEAQRMRFEDPVPEPRLGLLGDAEHAFALAAIEAGLRAAALEALQAKAAAPRLRSLPIVSEGETRRRDALGRFFELGVDGLVLRPHVAETRFQSMLDALVNDGTALVFLFEAHPEAASLAVLRVNEAELGRRAAQTVLAALPTGAPVKVGVWATMGGDLAQASRLVAAVETLKGADAVADVVLVESAPEPGSAVEALARVTQEDLDDEIAAWVFLGPWPLLGGDDLPWPAGEKFVVSVGARPDLLPAMQAGSVDALVAPDFFGWGRLAGRILLGHLVEAVEAPDESGDLQGPNQVIRAGEFDVTLERWGQWLR
ncbi:MAG: substrate-binding domain-containing protein [Opitutales bacterium]